MHAHPLSLGAVVAVALVAGTGAGSMARAEEDAKAQAKVHFTRGKEAFDEGRFEDALREYKRAFDLIHLPGFLFNIGQCHRNLGQPRKAIEAFKLYLEGTPEAQNRSAVKRLILELEQELEIQQKKLEEQKRTEAQDRGQRKPGNKPRGDRPDLTPGVKPEPAAVKPPPPARPPSRRPGTSQPFYKKWWFWTAVALAVGGGAVGTYFAVRSGEPDIPSTELGVLDYSR